MQLSEALASPGLMYVYWGLPENPLNLKAPWYQGASQLGPYCVTFVLRSIRDWKKKTYDEKKTERLTPLGIMGYNWGPPNTSRYHNSVKSPRGFRGALRMLRDGSFSVSCTSDRAVGLISDCARYCALFGEDKWAQWRSLCARNRYSNHSCTINLAHFCSMCESMTHWT